MDQRCVRCGRFVGLAAQKRNVDTCATCRRPTRKPAPPADLPHDVQLAETAAELRIGWATDHGLRMLPAALGLVVMAALSLYVGVHRQSWAHAVFFAAHVGIAIKATVMTVGGFVNRVEVVLRGDQLVASTAPIGRTRAYDTKGIEQLYVVRETDGRHAVYLRVRDEEKLLLRRIRTPERAFFLERELERRLGIEDAPVEGELPRRPSAR